MRKEQHDSRKKSRLRKIGLLLALNTLSFCAARLYWYSQGACGADLEVLRPADEGEVMYYLVAGCVNQPASAYAFLLDEDELSDGGITLVNYYSVRGCSMKTIARQVINDAQAYDYQARVIGISIGDYVSRRVEANIPGATSYGINPEPTADALHPWAKIATRAGSFVGQIASAAAGWLSVIPWYNGCGNHFSMAFIVDQFRDIGFITDTPKATGGVNGIIISERPGKVEGDEFLDNSFIEEYFPDVPVAKAKTGHGNTVDGAEEFLRAWRELK